MTLKIAIQMDNPLNIDINKDSSFVIALEAQRRGYELYYYNPSTLSLKEGEVSALCSSLEFRREIGNHCTLGAATYTNLEDFDIVLMRQDFNDPLTYNATTYILDHLRGKTLVLNDPTGVRESPEKILITHFPQFAPKTLITRNLEQIREFQKQHGSIILKPMNGFGGMDIYHMKPDDDNISSIYDMMTRLHPEPLIVQKYIPEVRQGDKRIIVVEGEPIAAVLRVPPQGEARANLCAGGSAQATEITDHEKDICKTLKPELVKRGLIFVGIDVIGDYVTEINPKSPTGLQQIYKLQGIKCEEAIWDAFENRLKK